MHTRSKSVPDGGDDSNYARRSVRRRRTSAPPFPFFFLLLIAWEEGFAMVGYRGAICTEKGLFVQCALSSAFNARCLRTGSSSRGSGRE